MGEKVSNKTLNILLGQAGSGKSTALYKECLKKAGKDLKKNFIFIVPEQVSNAVTERLIRESERGGILNIDVLSFQRLAHRIFDNAGGDDRELIDDTDKNLILRRVISGLKDRLKVIKADSLKQGYVSELKSVISEFVQYETGPDDILKAAEEEERAFSREKLKDIALIYREFNKVTAEKYVTKEELLDRASEAADRALFLKGSEIFLDDFTGFTPIQYRFLSSIFPLVDSVSVALDYDGADGELFSLSVTTIEKLRSIASDNGFNVNTVHFYDNPENRFKNTPGLGLLEAELFRRDVKKADPEERKNEGKEVRIIRCDIPEKEAAFAVSEVQRLTREEGLRYRDIGIIMSDPEGYGRVLAAEADRENVPLFLDITTDILLNPCAEFIRSALNAVRENFSYEGVFNFLRTGLTGISVDETDKLENYVRALNIRGKKAYSEEFYYHTKRVEGDQLLSINEVRKKLYALLNPITEVARGKKKAWEFADSLDSFIESSLIEERTEEIAAAFEEEGKKREAAFFRKTLEKIAELTEKIRELIGDEKMSLKEFEEILLSGMEAISIGFLPPGNDVVRAGDMTRSRLNDVKVLIFMGLNDSLIPKSGTGAGILSDFERERMKERGLNLSPGPLERTGIEKLYFYMNVCRPSEKLCLTYSLIDSEGKSIRPSFFVTEIERILTGAVKEYFNESEYRKKFYCRRDALEVLSDALKDKDREDEGKELFSAMTGIDETASLSKMLLDSICTNDNEDKISKAVSDALYRIEKGEDLKFSPTRLERFAECALRHFLSKGLSLEAREEAGFERSDLGSALHEALKLIFRMLKEKGKSIKDISDEEADSLAEESLLRYLRENVNAALNDGERNKYYIKRISRILKSALRILKNQSVSGGFEPAYFETGFEMKDVYGRIDRIDCAEKDGKLYLTVLDYKSGNKSFDLNRIYYGLDLQLFTYLKGAVEKEKARVKDKEVIPAGVFYFHIDDPVIDEDRLVTGSDEELRELRNEECRLRGIVNSDKEAVSLFDPSFEKKSSVIPVSKNKDGSYSAGSSVASPEDLDLITEHTAKKCDEFAKRIKDGEIKALPFVYGDSSPCKWCEFSDVCLVEKEQRLKKIGNTKEVIDKMREETENRPLSPE